MTSHDRNECDLRREDLHKTFDREPNAPDVAGHVAGCSPCTDALVALQSQRDALQYLSGDPANTDPIGDRTAIEQILSATARTGRGKLADLLYELAKACLVALPDFNVRIGREVEPREVEEVSNDLRRLDGRLGGKDGGVLLLGLPAATPEVARCLDAGAACLKILEQVEGTTERQQLALSARLIFGGDPAAAEELLERLLASDGSLTYKDYAQWNMMLALMNQRKYERAVEIGVHALGERPNDATVLYNVAASLTALRRKSELRDIAGRLSQRIAEGEPKWLIRLLRYERVNFADSLETTVEAVDELFGLSQLPVER